MKFLKHRAMSTHGSLQLMSSCISVTKINAEIPINQETSAFSTDNDVSNTDIMMKNLGIKESSIIHCNKMDEYQQSKEGMISTLPSIVSATAPTNSLDDLNSFKWQPISFNNIL